MSMSNVKSFPPSSFILTGNGREKFLRIRFPHPVIMYFRSGNPQHQQIDVMIQQAAQNNQSVTFGIFNVNTTEARRVLKESLATRVPITTTPMFLAYVNGSPFNKCNGADLRNFPVWVSKIVASISQMKTSGNNLPPGQVHSPQPAGGLYSNNPSPSYMPEQQGKNHGGMKQVQLMDSDASFVPPGMVPHNMPWQDDKDE